VNVELVRINKHEDIIPLTVGTYRLFLAKGQLGMEALLLYVHLMFTARLQETPKVKATDSYLRNGLQVGVVKLKKLKSFLKSLGLIEYVNRRGEDGRYEEIYIQVNLRPGKQGDPDASSSGTEIVPVDHRYNYRTYGLEKQMLKNKNKNKNKNSPSGASPSKTTAEKRSVEGYREFVDLLFQLHEKYTGAKYVFTKTDGAQVKRILNQIDPDDALARLHRYYDHDFWFTQEGRSLKGFQARINEIAVSKGSRSAQPAKWCPHCNLVETSSSPRCIRCNGELQEILK